MDLSSRELAWDGSVNARDPGGLGRVRPGPVVRMEQPRRLTETGWAAAWAYGVRTPHQGGRKTSHCRKSRDGRCRTPGQRCREANTSRCRRAGPS